jgi:hypothetical protein
VHSWLSFATSGWAGPVFIAVTVAGLALSGIAWRKKGARSGIRGIAWSLLPIAAWLTHALPLIGRIISAIVQFAGAVVLSPRVWLGVILVGVSAVLFLVSGGIPLVRWRRKRAKKPAEPPGGGQVAVTAPKARGKAAAPDEDDDLGDVRDILKRHGIS